MTSDEIREHVSSATNGHRAGNKGRGFVTHDMEERRAIRNTQRETPSTPLKGRVHILRKKTA